MIFFVIEKNTNNNKNSCNKRMTFYSVLWVDIYY